MKNRSGVIILTVILSILCLYTLSFTFISRGVEQDATAYATEEDGTVDLEAKQFYLDSIWREPVVDLGFASFTYQEVQETELALGLDLQGGMHVTLEIEPSGIVEAFAGFYSQQPEFQEALEKAREARGNTDADFVQLFYEAFLENNQAGDFATFFATPENADLLGVDNTDQEVIDILNQRVERAIDQSYEIIKLRVDRFGTTQPNIQRIQGTGRIQVEIPGAQNPARVRRLVKDVARLEFYALHRGPEAGQAVDRINRYLLARQDSIEGLRAPATEGTDTDQEDESIEDLVTPTEDITDLLGADTTAAVADSTAADTTATETEAADSVSEQSRQSLFFSLMDQRLPFHYQLRDTVTVNRILNNPEIQDLIPPTVAFRWASQPVDKEDFGVEEDLLELYIVEIPRDGQPRLTGEVITSAKQDYDQLNQPSVSMSMDNNGAQIWRAWTREASNMQPQGRIALVLDDYVLTAPTVQGEIPYGISSITGNFTLQEANDLATKLEAGALPAPVKIVEEAVIGPTLGKVAQSQGIISMVAGLAIVILFMVAYYNKGGLVANLALFFNIFFILGILANLGAALTLPGIAGIVLTIGMSIDANVLIFERIREELRNGVGLMAAITNGYKQAWGPIFDANATTGVTAVILLWLGQGPIKGFAVTLLIGILCSFFTAVFITRVFVSWMSKKGDQSKISFHTGLSKGLLSNVNVDFLRKRRLGYLFSTVFIAAGLAVVFTQGLNFGVDFTGGRSYVLNFSETVVPSELKADLNDTFEGAGTEVKTFGASNILKVTTSYLIADESLRADSTVQATLMGGVASATGLAFTQQDAPSDGEFSLASSSKVGSTIADDIKNSAWESALVALIMIFIYILVRFARWQFSVGAIVALFHDSLFVISAYAFAGLLGFQFEVDQVFVAAILTIIGYSINDTVVVFDRIREYIKASPGGKYDTIDLFNRAVNSTLSRTVITSITTLVVVLVLFIFGGEVLRGFSYSLLVGIIIGTYSSIFIATPVVVDLSAKRAIKIEERKVNPEATA